MRKPWSTGRPMSNLELRGFVFPWPRKKGKSVVPKAQESELRFRDNNLKSYSSPILTVTQMKILRMGESTENRGYTSTFDLDHWGLGFLQHLNDKFIILYLSVPMSPLLNYEALEDMNYIYSHSTWLSWMNWCCLPFLLLPPNFWI